MKTKSRNFLITSLTMIVMMVAILFGAVAISPLTAYAAGSVRVDFCLTNGALENNVFFENDSSKYFMSQQTKADGTLTSLEELYRTDSLDLEFDGWYTEKGEKATLETVFTEYTILYDRWKTTTLTDEDIISTLEIGTPLLEVGQNAGTYDTSKISLTDNRLSVQSVSVYEGLNAYRTNKLDDSDVLEAGKSYSLRIELHTKSGELIDDQLMSHSTATYGLVANMVYSHDNSGIFTTQWTNRENKIQVIINYDFENYCFTSDLEDKVVENGQSPQYTVYVSNNANIQGMELFVKNANDTWASLGAVTGQFNIPANSNVVKQYRVEVTYQNGFVISSNTFSVDWYDPNAPKFVTQPTDYNVAYGTNVLVTWGLNCDVSSIQLEKYDGVNWAYAQLATPTGTTVNAFESGTHTFRVHATKGGDDIYSEEFTITWREKFVFTTQPQSVTVTTGESAIVTWETNLLQTPLQTLQVFQLQTDTGSGWRHAGNLAENATSYDFGVSDFAYTQKYRLMANYDGTLYYSDEFTIEYIAGVFTSKPEDTINAIVGKNCLVEWEFNLDVKYYDIKVYENGNRVPFATTDKPEYNFTASEVGEKQFFIQAYNTNDQLIGEDYLLFRINWTEQQIVYLVSFNANGGTGTMQPVEQNAGSQYTLPTCTFIAPDGQIFKAWSVNDVEKKVGDQITINANTVVKAVWEDNLYQVIYQPGEASGNNEPFEYEANQTITFLDCGVLGYTRDGFEFDYWSIRILGDNFTEVAQKRAGETYTLTTNIIAVATWKAIPHECVGVLESGQGATCTVDGWKDYYQCACGKYYEDENCTILISDLEAWKAGEGKIVAEHTYGDLIDENPAVHTQTELQAGMRAHYHCSVCDTYFDENKVQTTQGALVIPAPQHVYGGFITSDPAQHWKQCTCGLKIEIADHTYDDELDNECNQCGHERDSIHECVGILQEGKNATCTENGWKDYYQCICNKFYADQSCESEILDLEAWKVGEGKILAGHSYGDLVAKVDATCSQTGMEAHYECSVCHTLFDENKVVKTANELTIDIDANAHTYGAWTSNGDGTHSRVCGINANHKETVACSGGTATCTEKAVCEVCNTPYGNTAAHDHGTTWKSDENNHWNECACGDKANVAPHADANNDGKCDICDYAMGTPENPGGDIEPENPGENIEPEKTGLSGGAIAGIAVGSVAVVGLGGFSLFWFVIKKKKFADLIALFKKK